MSNYHFGLVLMLSIILSVNSYMIGYSSGNKAGQLEVQYEAEDMGFGYFTKGEFLWD